MTKSTLLIVEDDAGLRSSLVKSFQKRGYEVLEASRASEARRIVHQQNVDLVLLDIRLAEGSGLDVLAEVRDLDDEIAVIMMTAFPEVKTAVRAMKDGARDFIVKPFELDELHLSVERVMEARELRREVRRLDRERIGRDEITEILGGSSIIEAMREQIRKVAQADTAVLVVGETGTGKELVADSIHRLSPRTNQPLIKVNCSAFSEQLLEDELFGHEKGAFTDAGEARAGLFEMASSGTLFLDEISEMKPGLQAKLLRVIEGMPFRRVGGQREIRTDVRVIAATNRDLQARIRDGLFREDLYYRINAFQIAVPPLRDRSDDIARLARFFLQRSATALRRPVPVLLSQAEAILLDYPWPGNVRELRNVMERAVILCETGEIGPAHIPTELRTAEFIRQHASGDPDALPTLKTIEHRYVQHVLQSTGDNLSDAARILGIARNTLKAKLGGQAESASRD
ncbi:MAG: sigma-54-dependent Fis family transcriptional regulator [Planctomycetes bacterium]|nr:sigma-54-dependent Fis family transcriptional regulator [Planctomycetota bacterium]